MGWCSAQVLAPLGHGAFGVVYSGLWRGLKVAVKTMVVQASSDPRQRERIVEEVAINASLSTHPNIVPTYHYDLRPLAALSCPDGCAPCAAVLLCFFARRTVHLGA